MSRPMAMRVRMTREVSSKVASIQGLIWRYGKRETMAELFESVCSIDTKKIQDALEKVVAESVEFEEVQGDAHTAS